MARWKVFNLAHSLTITEFPTTNWFGITWHIVEHKVAPAVKLSYPHCVSIKWLLWQLIDRKFEWNYGTSSTLVLCASFKTLWLFVCVFTYSTPLKFSSALPLTWAEERRVKIWFLHSGLSVFQTNSILCKYDLENTRTIWSGSSESSSSTLSTSWMSEQLTLSLSLVKGTLFKC